MNKSNVISLDTRRQQFQVNARMAQNSLTLVAAIQDARLNREDLKLLARLLDMRVLYDQMYLRHEPENRLIVSSVNKMQQAGYLSIQVRELLVGFRRNIARTPEYFWVFALTERELTRQWA